MQHKANSFTKEIVILDGVIGSTDTLWGGLKDLGPPGSRDS
jgi:hypothetical protein